MSQIKAPAIPGTASARATALPAGAESMRAEHARALAAHLPVAVLAIEPRLPRALSTPELRERALGALLESLRGLPQRGRMTAIQGTDTIVALIADQTLEQARALGEALVARSFTLAIPGLDARLGPAPCIGLAVADARHPHALATLLAVAIEGASVARARGGACCTHTELYALCAERLEREGTTSLASLFPRTTPAGLITPSAAELGARPQPAPAPAPAPSVALASPPPPKPTTLVPQPAARSVPSESPPASESTDSKVELLERRVAKLVAQLEETERKLAALERAKGVEPGVASVYREVQGVDADDERFALKNELMEQILQANLELRACIAEQAESAA